MHEMIFPPPSFGDCTGNGARNRKYTASRAARACSTTNQEMLGGCAHRECTTCEAEILLVWRIFGYRVCLVDGPLFGRAAASDVKAYK